ncbi:PP2C family protein-serine/threonine phosphatase [Angustibacter sp. McL0619]|uniref:PP2C family protein-serine/threonine phosphatase n=1 Tax=Angustibacter sp. McL0619 TaxID=3415676 RepID=UPI003CEE027B
MSEQRRTRVALLAAVCWLALIAAAELATGRAPTLVLSSLYGMAPLIACVAVPTVGTGLVALAAVALSSLSGIWTGTIGTSQHAVRLFNVALIGVVAVVIATVRVRREQRFARVARIAEIAQRTILPIVPSRIGPVRVAAKYVAAGQDALVGGDLFDFFHSRDRTYFIVGDVRGKGVGAVEQAARVIRAFRQAAGASGGLASVASEMSRYLAPFLGDEEFATAVLVEVTHDELTIVSCGHPPPLLITPALGGVLLEAPPGLPLGLSDRYEESALTWEPGSRLLLYTDGLSEARDQDGDFLPITPLAHSLAADDVERAVEQLLHTVHEYTRGQHATDDLAVVLLENTGVQSDEPDVRARFLSND